MKYLILSFALLLILSPKVQSKIWERVSTPFEYEIVNSLTSINGEIYVSKYDFKNNFASNFQYLENEWVRAVDDTIYKEFEIIRLVSQHKNRILVCYSRGVFLSEDNGENWTKIDDAVFSIDCDISPNGIFAIKKSSENHLFKYDEVDKEWKQLVENKYDTLQHFFVKQIESNDTHLFALQQKVANPFKYKDTASGGLFVSTDKGESWEKTLSDSTLLTVYATNELILVSAQNGRLFISNDNGATWVENNIGTSITNFTGDGRRILATSSPEGTIESRDDGKTWHVLNKSIYNSRLYKKDDKYFFMKNGLVYESDSLFTEIKPTNLIETETQVNRIYSHNDTLLCVGNFRRGVQYSTDLAKSWHTYYPFLEEEGVNIFDIHRKDNQFHLRASHVLYTSTDFGNTFEKNMTFGIYSDLLILEDKILLSGKSGRIISKDYGKSFINIDTTVLKNEYYVGEIAKTSKGDILAFSTYNGVFKSSDNAETWTQLVDSLPIDTTFESIDYFYEFNGDFYAVNFTPAILLKSTDKGVTWQEIEIELFNQIQYFFLEMIDENNIILSSYGDGLKGLWITNDQGKNWRRIDEDLPPLSEDSYRPYGIRGIFGNYIFVGSSPSAYGGSLYISTLDKLGVLTSVGSETERNYLYTLPPYPLPSQNEVRVQFYWDINLPMTVDDVSIFDLSGREVQTKDKLRIDKQANHYGNLTWDCSEAQPGIYIINIKHGTEERAVKVVVE